MIRPADLCPNATAPFVTCPTFLRIVIPAGKIGYVLVDSVAPIGNDQRWRHTIDTNFEFKRRDGRLPVCTDRVSCSRLTICSGRGLNVYSTPCHCRDSTVADCRCGLSLLSCTNSGK